jgi:subtilisin family serine protease
MKNTRWNVFQAGAVLLTASLLPAITHAAPIDSQISEQLRAKGTTNIFIKMARDADLDAAESIVAHAARVQFVHDALTTHANRDQAAIRAFLNARSADFKVFWINNSLYVRDAGPALVQALAARDDVAYLRADRITTLHAPAAGSNEARVATAEWGVDRVGAPQLWANGITGQGIVVANIDTGVRYTHEALVGSYRGNLGGGSFDHDYSWYDPTGICGDTPCDNNNHGTHTIGTIAGGDGLGPFPNDIGVAPDAKWIAAKGCESNSCSSFALTQSAQWIACPTRTDGTGADCSKAPHIVNNSWGGGSGDPWYESYVRSWVAAGIYPVFSIGNSGPGCSTAGSPGDYSLAIGVGSTTSSDVLSDFSSRGPGSFRSQKPDLVAPGSSVRSAVASSDGSYSSFSGTSMAAPHVAGALALMKQVAPDLRLLDAYKALLRSARRTGLGNPPGVDACGGRDYNEWPNYIYGLGLLDAVGAVNAID